MANLNKLKLIKSKKPFSVVDIVLIAVIIAAIVISMLILFGQAGGRVRVTSAGTATIYSLDSNQVIRISGHMNLNIVEGVVYVTESDCDNKVCENSGKISRVHQSIVCTPNNIFIEIIGQSSIDNVTGSIGRASLSTKRIVSLDSTSRTLGGRA